jgi:hypothetical protein
MIDRRIVSSMLLGIVAGTIGTMVYVAGRRRLWRYRSRPLARITLDLALVFGKFRISSWCSPPCRFISRARARQLQPADTGPRHDGTHGDCAVSRRAACMAGTALALSRSTVGHSSNGLKLSVASGNNGSDPDIRLQMASRPAETGQKPKFVIPNCLPDCSHS